MNKVHTTQNKALFPSNRKKRGLLITRIFILKLRKLADYLVKIQTFIILFILYFLFFVPLGIVFKIFSFFVKRDVSSFWQPILKKHKQNFYEQY